MPIKNIFAFKIHVLFYFYAKRNNFILIKEGRNKGTLLSA